MRRDRWRTSLSVAFAVAACGTGVLAWLVPSTVAAWLQAVAFCG